MEKKFRDEVLVTPLAAATVLAEVVPKETDTETLEEVIKFSCHLVIGWQRVWILAEDRLEEVQQRNLTKDSKTPLRTIQ